jgi:uncharacterized membrane protein
MVFATIIYLFTNVFARRKSENENALLDGLTAGVTIFVCLSFGLEVGPFFYGAALPMFMESN